jgi:hypothetical protein
MHNVREQQQKYHPREFGQNIKRVKQNANFHAAEIIAQTLNDKDINKK